MIDDPNSDEDKEEKKDELANADNGNISNSIGSEDEIEINLQPLSFKSSKIISSSS